MIRLVRRSMNGTSAVDPAGEKGMSALGVHGGDEQTRALRCSSCTVGISSSPLGAQVS
jgi:hypothetical protein